MIHQIFPTPVALYNETSSEEDNTIIKNWITEKHGEGRFVDISQQEDSIEAQYLYNLFEGKIREYVDACPFDFRKDEGPDLADIFSNRCVEFGPHVDEAQSPYILHNDLVDGDITLVYYPSMPQGQGGDLLFYNPSALAMFNHYDTLRYVPKERDLLIFPSHLIHRVTPYFGKEPRISITAVYKYQKLQKTRRPFELLSNNKTV